MEDGGGLARGGGEFEQQKEQEQEDFGRRSNVRSWQLFVVEKKPYK